MHGYSLLRPTLNTDYFHDLYDQAEQFGIEVEGHREFGHPLVSYDEADVELIHQIRRLDLVYSSLLWPIPTVYGWQITPACSSCSPKA